MPELLLLFICVSHMPLLGQAVCVCVCACACVCVGGWVRACICACTCTKSILIPFVLGWGRQLQPSTFHVPLASCSSLCVRLNAVCGWSHAVWRESLEGRCHRQVLSGQQGERLGAMGVSVTMSVAILEHHSG